MQLGLIILRIGIVPIMSLGQIIRREIEEGDQTTYFCTILCVVTNIPVPLVPQLPLDLESEMRVI